MYKVEDKITISSQDLQNWCDNDITPKGLEDFQFDGEIDVDSGDFDSGKSSMTDYEICLYNEKLDHEWVGIGGYYNWSCGHQFNYDITFEKRKETNIKTFIGNFNEEDIENEDGGCAKIITFDNEDNEMNGMFVRIQSWDETLKHEDFNKFLGKKVRITIETID